VFISVMNSMSSMARPACDEGDGKRRLAIGSRVIRANLDRRLTFMR
jgi:hypothetical protein